MPMRAVSPRRRNFQILVGKEAAFMSSVSRRDFIEAALAACACAICPLVAAQPGETSSTQAAAPISNQPVDIGDAKSFAVEGIYDKWADSNGFFVVKNKGYIYVVSRTCTHKAGRLIKDPDNPNGIKCTKHKGVYTNTGEPVSGP